MKLSSFLSNKSLVKEWLDEEKAKSEEEEIYLRYWLYKSGVGLVISSEYSGEMHATSDGTVTMHLEDSDGNVIYKHKGNTNDSQVLKNMLENFKQRAINT